MATQLAQVSASNVIASNAIESHCVLMNIYHAPELTLIAQSASLDTSNNLVGTLKHPISGVTYSVSLLPVAATNQKIADVNKFNQDYAKAKGNNHWIAVAGCVALLLAFGVIFFLEAGIAVGAILCLCGAIISLVIMAVIDRKIKKAANAAKLIPTLVKEISEQHVVRAQHLVYNTIKANANTWSPNACLYFSTKVAIIFLDGDTERAEDKTQKFLNTLFPIILKRPEKLDQKFVELVAEFQEEVKGSATSKTSLAANSVKLLTMGV